MLRTRLAIAIAVAALLTGLVGVVDPRPASAIPIPPSTSTCSYNGNPGVVTASNSTTTAVTVTCTGLPANTNFQVVQASALGGVVSPSSGKLQLFDQASLVTMHTDTAGNGSALINVTATGGSPSFSAPDGNAVCPPTQAQVNAGLVNCVVSVASINTTRHTFTAHNSAFIVYGTQPSPNPPTLVTLPAAAAPGTAGTDTTLTASDAPGACPTPPTADSRCWWGSGVFGAPNTAVGVPGFRTAVNGVTAANTLRASPAVYCRNGATAAACTGLAAGTLVPPALSGTITTPGSGLQGVNPVVADEPTTGPNMGNGTLPPILPGKANVEATATFVVPVAITTTGLPDGTAFSPYTATLAGIGGTTPYSWSVTVGSLPAGLSLNASTGTISGTPTAAGTTSFTVTVTDATPTTTTPPGPFVASRSLSITVRPASLTITTMSLPDAQAGKPYAATVTAIGGTSPYTWSITSGSLPRGLSLDPATGVISGTPTRPPGTYSFVVTVTDAVEATASRGLSITVSPGP
jgi:hypothetical protein